MTPQDWFGIVLRASGVWMVLAAVSEFGYALAIERGWWRTAELEAPYYVALGLADAVAGFILLCGADQIVWFAYGRRDEVSQSGGEDLQNSRD